MDTRDAGFLGCRRASSILAGDARPASAWRSRKRNRLSSRKPLTPGAQPVSAPVPRGRATSPASGLEGIRSPARDRRTGCRCAHPRRPLAIRHAPATGPASRLPARNPSDGRPGLIPRIWRAAANERRDLPRHTYRCSSWYPNYGCLSGSALILAKAARKCHPRRTVARVAYLRGRRWSSPGASGVSLSPTWKAVLVCAHRFLGRGRRRRLPRTGVRRVCRCAGAVRAPVALLSVDPGGLVYSAQASTSTNLPRRQNSSKMGYYANRRASAARSPIAAPRLIPWKDSSSAHYWQQPGKRPTDLFRGGDHRNLKLRRPLRRRSTALLSHRSGIPRSRCLVKLTAANSRACATLRRQTQLHRFRCEDR